MSFREKVVTVLEKVRPALQMDGGDIEVAEILEDEKVVLVRLRGACYGCPMSTMTVKGYVEQTLKEEIPELSEVRLVK